MILMKKREYIEQKKAYNSFDIIISSTKELSKELINFLGKDLL